MKFLEWLSIRLWACPRCGKILGVHETCNCN
jgi:acetone carboxylase gamma subunit